MPEWRLPKARFAPSLIQVVGCGNDLCSFEMAVYMGRERRGSIVRLLLMEFGSDLISCWPMPSDNYWKLPVPQRATLMNLLRGECVSRVGSVFVSHLRF